MTIDFNCPNCGAAIHAPQNLAGRKGTCIKCNEKLQIPMKQSQVPSNPSLSASLQSPTATQVPPPPPLSHSRERHITPDSLSLGSGTPRLESESPQTARFAQLHLRDCPVCNNAVSSDAELCPKCGHPFPRLSRFVNRTGRGWAIPSAIWLAVAICATALQGCPSVIGAKLQPIGITQEKSTGEVLVTLAIYLLVGVNALGVHWFLIWRRRVNLELPTNRYWVWTGLHIAWTGLALLVVLFSLAFLPMVYSDASSLPVRIADPHARGKALLLVIGTILNALSVAGWVLIAIVVPPSKIVDRPPTDS